MSSNPAASPRGVGQAYALYAIALLLVVTVGSIAQFAALYVGLAITELICILLPAIVYLRVKGMPLTRSLRLNRIDAATAVLAIATGVCGWGAAKFVFYLTVPLIGEGPVIQAFFPTTLPDLLVLLVCGAVLAGVCEEILFRGVLQGTLERYGSAKAILFTALLFAAFHLNRWNFLPALLLGAVFGVMVLRTKSTISAILAHTSCNATAFTVAYVLREQPESAVYPIAGALAAGFAILVPLFLWRTHGREAQWSLLATVNAEISRRAGVILAATAFVAILLVPATVFAFLDVYVIANNALEPEVRQGDYVVVLTPRVIDVSISAGDLVAFKEGKKTFIRKVVRIETDDVIIHDQEAERMVPRHLVYGKVVHKTRLLK
jgi:membrane protease YdiL (CAAX protease family)